LSKTGYELLWKKCGTTGISNTPTQAKVQALRDKCEEPAKQELAIFINSEYK
jgi:hypothetical protein